MSAGDVALRDVELVNTTINRVPELSEDITVSAAPNPFNDALSIQYRLENKVGNEATLHVFDLLGREILSQKLHVIARNEATEGSENDLLLSVEAYENVLILQETNDQKRQELIAALEQLTPRQKELIVLRYFEEMSYADISEKTQLQTDTIYKTIHEALKRLRLILKT